MLTYRQIQDIAQLLCWSIREVEESIAQLNAGFMTPQIQDFMEDDPETEGNGAGYYHRLSASGYMDCTDWSGPFQSEECAVADLLQTYAD